MMKLAIKGEDKLSSCQRDYLDAISVFVARYDDEHFLIPKWKSSPLDRLKYKRSA